MKALINKDHSLDVYFHGAIMHPTHTTSKSALKTQTNTQPFHMQELQKSLAPNGVFGQFLSSGKFNSVDSRTTLGALCYLYRGDNKEEFRAFSDEYERIKVIVNQTARSPEEKTTMLTQLSMTVTKAVLDSGKLEPALTGLLRFTLNAKADFNSKCQKMNITNAMFSQLDSSMVLIGSHDLHDRLAALKAFTFIDSSNTDSRKDLQIKFGIPMQEILENPALTDGDSDGFFFDFAYKVLNARIADTCELQFAKKYGEIMASSNWEGESQKFVEDTFSQSSSAKPAEPLSTPGTSEGISRAEMAQNNTWYGSPIPPQTVVTTTANAPSQYAPVQQQQQQQQPAVTTTANAPYNPYLTTSTVPMNMAMYAPVNTAVQASNMMPQKTSIAAPTSGEKRLIDFGFPLDMQRQDVRMAIVAKRLEIFYEKCSPKVGSNRERLLREYPELLKEMVLNMNVVSIKGDVDVKKLAFNRNILPKADKDLNGKLLGNGDVYFEQHPKSLIPGAQVAIGVKIPMCLPNGQMVQPHVLSVATPSLIKDQGSKAEIKNYIKKSGTLSTASYKAAREGMSDRILAYAKTLQPSPQRVVLSASGMGPFLSGLDDAAKKKAQKIAVKEMANLVENLRSDGQTVSFTDTSANSDFWMQVSAELGKGKAVDFAGTVPGNWIGDNDLIINSTSSIDQPGNGGEKGDSLDGQFGDTLMFDAHVLRSIMESLNMMQY